MANGNDNNGKKFTEKLFGPFGKTIILALFVVVGSLAGYIWNGTVNDISAIRDALENPKTGIKVQITRIEKDVARTLYIQGDTQKDVDKIEVQLENHLIDGSH